MHFFPKGQDGRWAWSALYNRVDSDDPVAEVEMGSLTLSYLLARNVRFLAEVAQDIAVEATEASAGLIVAF